MASVRPRETADPKWPVSQRIYCVQRHQKHGSFKKIQAEFAHRFQTNKSPSKSTIQGWIKNFGMYGSVRNQNAASRYKTSNSGRPTKRTNDVIEAVQNSVQQSPKRSVRKRAQSLGLSASTCWRVSRNDLGLYPYRIQIHQLLSDEDKKKRKTMAAKIIQKSSNSANFLDFLWTSDEAHFHLHGRVNSKTNVFWGSNKPDEVASIPLHSPKCTVWAAISSKGIVGPVFFEDDEGETATVNKERYVDVLNTFKGELTSRFPSWYASRWWFQQDGASPHTSKLALEWLKNNFGDRVISLKSDFEWAPHSPDLSPPDFFLWGYLKDRVYKNRPHTLLELKENIRVEIAAISQETCKAVMKTFLRRMELCAAKNGGHLEHLM